MNSREFSKFLNPSYVGTIHVVTLLAVQCAHLDCETVFTLPLMSLQQYGECLKKAGWRKKPKEIWVCPCDSWRRKKRKE